MTLHGEHRAFIENALQAGGPTRRVVVTHHLPSAKSLDPRYAGEGDACYASDLEEIIGRLKPAAWIHGHTHKPSDYLIGKTRIACMPKGYGPEDDRPLENEDFRTDFVIEI